MLRKQDADPAAAAVLQSKPLDAIDLLDDIASRAGSAVDTAADGGGGRTEALLNLDGNLAALVAEQYAADGTTLGLWKLVRGETDAGHTGPPGSLDDDGAACPGYVAGERVGGREACADLDSGQVCGLHVYCLRCCPPGVPEDSTEDRNLAAQPQWSGVVTDLLRRVAVIESSGDILAPEGRSRGGSNSAAVRVARAAGGWTAWL